jgi:hypothetical protein
MIKDGQGHTALSCLFFDHPHLIQQNCTYPKKGQQMAEQLDPNELVNFKELLMANSIQVDTLTQLLIDKGVFTKEEFLITLKTVQKGYQKPQT